MGESIDFGPFPDHFHRAPKIQVSVYRLVMLRASNIDNPASKDADDAYLAL